MRRQPALLSCFALATVVTAPSGLAQEAAKEQPWRLGTAIDAPDWLKITGSVRPRYETLTNTLVAGRSGGDELLSVQTLLKAEINTAPSSSAANSSIRAWSPAMPAAALPPKSMRLSLPSSISPGARRTSCSKARPWTLRSAASPWTSAPAA